MRKREPLRLTWRGAGLGVLTEAAYVVALFLVAGLAALLFEWGTR